MAHTLPAITFNTPSPDIYLRYFFSTWPLDPGFATFTFEAVSIGFIAGKSKTSLMSIGRRERCQNG